MNVQGGTASDREREAGGNRVGSNRLNERGTVLFELFELFLSSIVLFEKRNRGFLRCHFRLEELGRLYSLES